MKNAALTVVLPAGRSGRIRDPGLLRWMSRGHVSVDERPMEALHNVLHQLAVPEAAKSLAALRYWGQSGERPAGWLAAADPVHLETRLRDLRIRPLPSGSVSAEEWPSIIGDFTAMHGEGSPYRLETLGSHGYIFTESGFPAADVSAEVAAGHVADAFHAAGANVAARDRLLSEMQMFLHEHPINRQREHAGLPPINSLWLWGAGEAPPAAGQALPVLYASDPLFRGHWLACCAECHAWPGDIGACLPGSDGACVVVVPDDASHDKSDPLHRHLLALQQALANGDIGFLTLVFRDGLVVRIRRAHRARLWRRVSPLLQGDLQNG